MGVQAIYQISLVAAFIAGAVALFAPCCISYLFPAYIGNIFKERRRVLLMTFVYSLGIFVVMMPIVLGAKALQMFFFRMHDNTYLFGGAFMIVVAVLSFLGIKLPMPHVSYERQNKTDLASSFMLGVFAGITSACCAPVLIGVVGLSALTPTLLQSLGVGVFYVLGMVTPLYLASVFVHKSNILSKPWLKKKLTEVSVGARSYPVFVSNIVAAAIFVVTGVIMIILTLTGHLGMTVAESQVTKTINAVAWRVTEMVGTVPGIDLAAAAIGGYLLYAFIRSATREGQVSAKHGAVYYTCPMHPEIKQDKPGTCPKCGGMPLVAKAMRGKELIQEHGIKKERSSL